MNIDIYLNIVKYYINFNAQYFSFFNKKIIKTFIQTFIYI